MYPSILNLRFVSVVNPVRAALYRLGVARPGDFMKYNKSDQSNVVQLIDFKGRMVDKNQFRAFIFNSKGERHLAETYDEYIEMVSSGLWFDSLIEAQKIKPKKRRVKKNASDSA